MNKKFTVEVHDYESGKVEDPLTIERLEAVIADLLDESSSDGVVIVTEVSA